MTKKGALGCYLSHLEVYKLNPNESVIIFEDDCIINDSNMLDILCSLKRYDLVYFGVNMMWDINDKTKCKPISASAKTHSWGTHAMWVSEKAKKIFFEYTKNIPFTKTLDNLWNFIEDKYNLSFWRPPANEIYKYCRQKIGLLSEISNKQRIEYNTKCKTPNCLYVINLKKNNNDGYHCCWNCSKGKPYHGRNCGHVLFKEHTQS
jgi:GR25 family glycosyltransferase involved in LPS biosynthesis